MLIHVISMQLFDAILKILNYSLSSCALTDSFIIRTSSVGAIGSNSKTASRKTGERERERERVLLLLSFPPPPLSLSPYS